MDYRKYVLTITLMICCLGVKAQDNRIAVADSISTDLNKAGDWKKLIDFGRETIAAGVDFPGLRLKIAFAWYITGNYKAALGEYNYVLDQDSYNQTARFYAYYSCKFLNDTRQASYHAKYLDKETLAAENIFRFGLIDAGLELGKKFANNDRRSDGFYSRVGITNRLGWRLQLEQSVVYFNQKIYDWRNFGQQYNYRKLADDQTEYFGKLSYSLNERFVLLGSYHYLNTKYRSRTYHSNVGLVGIKYANTDVDLQADVNFGQVIKQPLTQYNAKLVYYPLGNLNLYTVSRATIKHFNGENRFVYNQALGFKVVDKTWLETSVTFGSQENYIDADGLYVYNALDNTNLKTAETAFYQLSNHAQVQFTYTYEKKSDAYFPRNYSQNSITLGVLWRF